MKGMLTNAEWEVMNALWGREPQVLSEVINSMGGAMDWSYRTYASYLRTLSEKGFVGFDARGRDKFYYPLVEREDCVREEGRSLMKRMKRAGTKELLLCMIQEGGLEKEDREELQELLDGLAKGE